jgi:hypothetical protein
MPAPTVDAGRIVETLNRHEVRYVVVGGFAVELWDVAVQPTVDVDITPEMSKLNLKRLAAALNELDAGIRYANEVVAIPGGLTADSIADMRVLNLATSAGPLDITVIPAGTSGFDDLVEKASEIDYSGTPVPTASLEDVARSKEAAGRPKDLRVLPAIRAHLQRIDRKSS